MYWTNFIVNQKILGLLLNNFSIELLRIQTNVFINTPSQSTNYLMLSNGVRICWSFQYLLTVLLYRYQTKPNSFSWTNNLTNVTDQCNDIAMPNSVILERTLYSFHCWHLIQIQLLTNSGFNSKVESTRGVLGFWLKRCINDYRVKKVFQSVIIPLHILFINLIIKNTLNKCIQILAVMVIFTYIYAITEINHLQ